MCSGQNATHWDAEEECLRQSITVVSRRAQLWPSLAPQPNPSNATLTASESKLDSPFGCRVRSNSDNQDVRSAVARSHLRRDSRSSAIFSELQPFLSSSESRRSSYRSASSPNHLAGTNSFHTVATSTSSSDPFKSFPESLCIPSNVNYRDDYNDSKHEPSLSQQLHGQRYQSGGTLIEIPDKRRGLRRLVNLPFASDMDADDEESDYEIFNPECAMEGDSDTRFSSGATDEDCATCQQPGNISCHLHNPPTASASSYNPLSSSYRLPAQTWSMEHQRAASILRAARAKGLFFRFEDSSPFPAGFRRSLRVVQAYEGDRDQFREIYITQAQTYRQHYANYPSLGGGMLRGESGTYTYLSTRQDIEDDCAPQPSTSRAVFRQSNIAGHAAFPPEMMDLEMLHETAMVIMYESELPVSRSDVWPNIRDLNKLPIRYFPIETYHTSTRKYRRDLRVTRSARKRKMNQASIIRRHKKPKQKCVPVCGDIRWPPGKLPTELYEEIASYLSRDDIKAMRLTCKEFDRHISQVLFETVVVPFNVEIYGMLQSTAKRRRMKGKGKADDTTEFAREPSLLWENAHQDDIYEGHGIDVFKGFGPHIHRFGMSFDVDEYALVRPPHKGATEGHKSYWGAYDWPFEQYRRFENIAGLELAADETPKMKTAFSMLSRVQALGLSLDSGLGWLTGPDVSIKSLICRRAPPVFGTRRIVPQRKIQAQRRLWKHLEDCHSSPRNLDLKCVLLRRREMGPFDADHPNLLRDRDDGEMIYLESRLLNEVSIDRCPFLPPDGPEDACTVRPAVHRGLLYTCAYDELDALLLDQYVTPNKLTKAQQEWLLETEWAQRAFLSSYMLAILDNRDVFANVRSLTFKLSSRFVISLCRPDFWDAIPALRTVELKVIADWRDVTKDEAGYVETPSVNPSTAVGCFVKLLWEMIAPRNNIKALNVGWASGGENAEGIHARNKHLLPAPIVPAEAAIKPPETECMVSLPYVEHLTLSNCWITPPNLLRLVSNHKASKLTKLTLDSVSLTVTPRPSDPTNNNNHNYNGFATHDLQHMPVAGAQVILPHGPGHAHHQPPGPAPPANATPNAPPYREGSWPSILSHAIASPQNATTTTTTTIPSPLNSALHTLTLLSCGYARLADFSLDQSALEEHTLLQQHRLAATGRQHWFTKRYGLLLGSMMASKDALLGEIVSGIPAGELWCLESGWGVREGGGEGNRGGGGDDEDEDVEGGEDEEQAEGRRKLEESEFDGCVKGGVGRISGVVERGGVVLE